MNILVTGGTGFIGSHLVDSLVAKHHHVRVPIRPNSNLTYLPINQIETSKISLTNSNNLDELIDGMDIIFHLASIRTEWGILDAERRRVNIETTAKLLKASLNRIKRFFYISSVSVHGHFSKGPANEDFPIQPFTRYGKCKAEAEQLVMNYNRTKGVPVTIIRPVITYGPRDLTGMITKLISLIYSGKYRTVGSGNNRVHLIYIDDLIQGFLLALENPYTIGKAYIIAGEKPITINDLVLKISKLLFGKEQRKLHVPLWTAKVIGTLLEWSYHLIYIGRYHSIPEPIVTRSKIDIMTIDRSYDIHKAKAELGYQPKYDYEEGIRLTIDWLQKQNILQNK